MSSSSEHPPEAASFFAGDRRSISARAVISTQEIFSRAPGTGHAPVRNTVLNLDCAGEQDYFGD